MHHHFSSFDLDIEPVIVHGLKNIDIRKVYGFEVPMLQPLENGLILLAHIRQHLLQEAYSLGLRQIIDWMMYVHKYSGSNIRGIKEKDNTEDCIWDDEFIKLAANYHLDTLAITVTYICKHWLGLPNAPKWCEDADKDTARELLDTILSSGNFGTKFDKTDLTLQQGLSNVSKKGVIKYLKNKATANSNDVNMIARPFVALHSLIMVFCRGIVAVLKGKNVFHQVFKGSRKGKLLRELKL